MGRRGDKVMVAFRAPPGLKAAIETAAAAASLTPSAWLREIAAAAANYTTGSPDAPAIAKAIAEALKMQSKLKGKR